MTQVRRNALIRSLCILVFLGCACHAQDKCNVEIKMLLSPTETQAAITSLKLKKETAGRVYFFDTSDLDLLAQGCHHQAAARGGQRSYGQSTSFCRNDDIRCALKYWRRL